MRGGFANPGFAVPDFSRFTTRAGCEAAVYRRELVELDLLPGELRGDGDICNRVFVPPCIAEQKRRIDADTILPLMRAGKLKHYHAQPVFRGRSLVPVEITLHAHGPAGYATTLSIW